MVWWQCAIVEGQDMVPTRQRVLLRPAPDDLRRDPVLYGECLSGALYWNDFLELARAAGFADPRLVTDKPVAVEDL